MTMAMTIAATMRMPHSTSARFELRLGDRGGCARPAVPPPPSPEPSAPSPPPPTPLPEGGGPAPGEVSMTMVASTFSVTEVAPLLHPRRSDARNGTRALPDQESRY